ncbi:MAG: 16S rRNA (cytidine(1402)-2'-O)-methyltransferase [Fimbriimonadaceae bacterium]
MAGRLILVSTPIGNLGDLSARAGQALQEADFWLVEDTRVSGKLQGHLGIKKPMRVVNEHSAEPQLQKFVSEIESGLTAALLTDGGSPAISDPGAMLADLCHEAGIEVAGVPGPSAVTLALALSGFFAQRFAFLGFLGRKPGAIRSELAQFADSPYTLVLFESPFRIDKTLEAAHEALGERRYALCREMTKAFEQVYRSRLPEKPSEKDVPRKGEFTIVIEGKRKADVARDEWGNS